GPTLSCAIPLVSKGNGGRRAHAPTAAQADADPGGAEERLRAHRDHPRPLVAGPQLRHHLPHPARAPQGPRGQGQARPREPRPRPRPAPGALRARGDSMADRIEDGDVVLLQRVEPQRSGEVCAVRVGEDESTLKYLEWSPPRSGDRPARYRLRPHNPSYPTLTVAAAELHIDGVMRGLIRGDVVQDLLFEGSG